MDWTRVRAERRRRPTSARGRGEVTQAQKAGLRPCTISSCRRHDEKRFGPSPRNRSAQGDVRRHGGGEGRTATTPERNTQGRDRPDGDTQRACPGEDRRPSWDRQAAGARRFGRSSEKLERAQQAFAFEIQTGLGAIESELEAARPTGEPRRAARPRKAFPAHLERVEIVIQPEPWGKKRSRSQSSSPSNAVGRTGLRNGTVPPSLRYRGTVLRAHPNSFARRFPSQAHAAAASLPPLQAEGSALPASFSTMQESPNPNRHPCLLS